MKSIQNLLRFSENNQTLATTDMTNIKGGNNKEIVLETMVEITCVTNGNTSILYCDRRRKRIGG